MQLPTVIPNPGLLPYSRQQRWRSRSPERLSEKIGSKACECVQRGFLQGRWLGEGCWNSGYTRWVCLINSQPASGNAETQGWSRNPEGGVGWGPQKSLFGGNTSLRKLSIIPECPLPVYMWVSRVQPLLPVSSISTPSSPEQPSKEELTLKSEAVRPLLTEDLGTEMGLKLRSWGFAWTWLR